MHSGMARNLARLSVSVLLLGGSVLALAQTNGLSSRFAPDANSIQSRSAEYEQVQQRLARGWNTWDTHSIATQVLLPEGLAIHVGVKHNSSENGDAFLQDALIGRLEKGAEIVTPGPHAWDGSYTRADFEWKGHQWVVESAHDGDDLLLVVSPLPSKAAMALPATVVFSVNYLWNRSGQVEKNDDEILADGPASSVKIYCTCSSGTREVFVNGPISGSYFAADLTGSVGISTGKRRTVDEIIAGIVKQRDIYNASVKAAGSNRPILSAIETTLGWDTIYDPEKQRVISPVSRVWSVGWGGYVLFDWDTFFAATMAGIGDKDLAYADALETLREETAEGFVPNYARAGGWKSSDRSEPPVGAITVLGLYNKFHDRWFLAEAFEPLLRWNRWWAAHRDMQGFIVLGSDADNQPVNLDDTSRGTWQGAVYESGLDNSPMYDGTFYNPQTHLLEFADVGMTSLYIADCDALAEIAEVLSKAAEAKELRDRSARYRGRLATLWDAKAGIFLNKNLHTGQLSSRLSPTNFYPLLAHAATPEQARTMIARHLRNPDEFWGQWILPSIARNDPAFHDQNYWRGRIWGPMNYLVYLGLCNDADADTRRAFASKSYELFVKEWRDHGHVHENYNGINGSGDDVNNSDRFYHW
ncbi:MAG TPA: trehalase family glycosidase, partial [Terracidiphilus sp.]|nr:trehalase family glycosidase [Terracidiphilus sp.]